MISSVLGSDLLTFCLLLKLNAIILYLTRFLQCPNCVGLYYDGNNGIWYSFDQQTQQYVPCTNQNDKTSEKQPETSKTSDGSGNRKVVISAPAATITSNEKASSLPDAIQAAANAAIAAEKKEKEKAKEIRLASKSSILANKKKMSNVLTMWKQRSHECQAPRVALDDSLPSAPTEDKSNSTGLSAKNKFKTDLVPPKENVSGMSGLTMNSASLSLGETQERPRPVSSSSGGTLKGVIRGSGIGVIKSDTYTGASGIVSTPFPAAAPSTGASSLTNIDASTNVTPFRTDASALGSYAPAAASGSGKRRFSEMPQHSTLPNKDQPHTTYRDRAAERRSLYGSSSFGDDMSESGSGDSSKLSIVCYLFILSPPQVACSFHLVYSRYFTLWH